MSDLRVGQITFKDDGSKAIIALPSTKTSGPNSEEVVLHDPVVTRALAQACTGRCSAERICWQSPRCFGDDLRWLAGLVGFRHARLTPYSLRRGGATWHLHRYGSLSSTTILGRWQQEKTARIYIAGAASEWTAWQFSERGGIYLQRAAALYNRRFQMD